MVKMSHSVMATHKVTTSSSSIIMVNFGYCKSATGLLKIFETILGAICLGWICYYCIPYSIYGKHPYSPLGFVGNREETFFFLVTVVFLVTTFLLLLACLISLSSATILPKSTLETLYHFVASIFYIAASIALLIQVSIRNLFEDEPLFRERGYEGKLALAALGICNSVLYVLSFIVSLRTFRMA